MSVVRFITEDNLELNGTLDEPRKRTSVCIILCHGFHSNRDEGGNFAGLSSCLTERGFAVMRFDFRAQGESEGKQEDLTISGEEKDLEAALKFMISRGYIKFGIVAASFSGGAVSLFVPKHLDYIRALVLLYARLNFKDYLKTQALPEDAKSSLEKQDFILYKGFRIGKELISEMQEINPVESLKGFNGPILLIQGDKDLSVPYSEAISASNELGARIITVQGAGHGFFNDREKLPIAINAIANFFLENFDKTEIG